jgi:trigger factor
LKIKKKDLDDRQVELTVEVPDDRVQAAMRSAARRLSKRTKIPGFRPGKAPFDVILRKFGDETVFEEALDDLGQAIYKQAIDETELEPYAAGRLDEIVSKEPLVLRYTVPQSPEVDLGGYRDLRLPFEASEVGDDTLEEAMEEIRQGQAVIEHADRETQDGDVIVLDIKAEMREPDEGMNPVLISEQDLSLLVSETTEWPFPGFHEHLLGFSAEGTKDFSHTFAEDHPNEALRNRVTDFHLVCKEVKSRFVPEWSDDLARAVGDFDDLLALRIGVREQLEAQEQRKVDSEYARSVIDATVEGAEVSYPPVLLEEELDGMLRDLAQRLENQRLTLEDYLKIEGKTIEELREELKPQAQDRLKQALVLGKVVEVETIEVNADEIKAEIDRLVAPFGENAGKLRKSFEQPLGRRRVELDLLTEKAIQQLVSFSKGEADSSDADNQKTIDDQPESDKDKSQE